LHLFTNWGGGGDSILWLSFAQQQSRSWSHFLENSDNVFITLTIVAKKSKLQCCTRLKERKEGPREKHTSVILFFLPKSTNGHEKNPGADPTTSKFSTILQCRCCTYIVHKNYFYQCRRKYFCFQNALGYSWRCTFLQRWRCNSRP
jgi:hypothetical protein